VEGPPVHEERRRPLDSHALPLGLVLLDAPLRRRGDEIRAEAIHVEVELPGVQPPALQGRARKEYDIATRVSRQTMARSVTADLLIVSGLRPQHAHEVRYLAETLERRYRDKLATIILTPDQPHELADEISRSAEFGEEIWHQIESRLYETNLIAI